MESIVHLGDFRVDIFLPLPTLISPTPNLRPLSPNSAKFFDSSRMILKLNILEMLLNIFLGLIVMIVIVNMFMYNFFRRSIRDLTFIHGSF